MAGKQKESSLLFSSNIASPFDDLSASAVLLPPVVSKPEIPKSESDFSQSLQPHLKSGEPSLSSSFTFGSSSSLKESVSTSTTTFPPPLPPSFKRPPTEASSGSSFLRKPPSKYVVPSNISTFANASPALPQFPPPTVPVVRAPFVPPLPASDSPALTFNPDHFGSTENPQLNLHNVASSPQTSFMPYDNSQSTVIPASFSAMASDPPPPSEMYHPVIHHWFYADGKGPVWRPFSFTDSINLEQVFRQEMKEVVATDGGRFDVDVQKRSRTPVYWEAPAVPVMRCSWFRRTFSESSPVPFSEESAEKLENVYKEAMVSGHWHRQVELPGGERVMVNSPHSMHHYQAVEPIDIQNITSVSESQTPLTVRRGADDFIIKDGASEQVDHLVFLIHGIGSFCDLSFRSVEECVNDFRALGEELLSTHFKDAIDRGEVGRVDILPISWHKALHGDATGLDAKLKNITLRSIPKLRDFTNDTLLDILFYTSPVYCQHIMDIVASEMSRLLTLFKQRHPSFDGSVSVGGHSLGSVILFDLLMHQTPDSPKEELPPQEIKDTPTSASSNLNDGGDESSSSTSLSTSQVNFKVGAAGTGQPAIVYPQLPFKPKAFFLMGSPVGMFVTVRGIDQLGPDFRLPTCDHVYNIFHPFDPVAYRIETLIDSSLEHLRPVLIPHHKGRKRMHLELKDTIERVGSDIKNKIFDSISATWNKVYQIYSGSSEEEVRKEVDLALQEQIQRLDVEEETATNQRCASVGQLNRGERVDYVLQEKPYESFTEYIFALQAHLTYWTSEDTMLMILKELYKMKGVLSDGLSEDGVDEPGRFPVSTPIAYQHNPYVPPLENIAPSPPVPLLPMAPVSATPPLMGAPLTSAGSSAGILPPSLIGSQSTSKPKQLRGRPVFDPFKVPSVTQMGMDPTASPLEGSVVAPPPMLPNVRFNKPQRK